MHGACLQFMTTPDGSTSTTTKMTITGDGEVGIGTTAPTELLDVDSDAIRIRDSQTPSASVGASGDYEGMIAWDTSYLYVCTADYDGTTDVWKRVAIATW